MFEEMRSEVLAENTKVFDDSSVQIDWAFILMSISDQVFQAGGWPGASEMGLLIIFTSLTL